MAIVRIDYEIRDTFEDAVRAGGVGYLDPVLVKDAPPAPHLVGNTSVIGLPEFVGHGMAAIAIAFMTCGVNRLRVLDVGGGLAGHFGFLTSTFGAALPVTWTVLETPVYVDYAREYIRDEHLFFENDLDTLNNQEFDLIYLSSILPYYHDWQDLMGADIVRQAPYIYISRTPIADEEIPFLQTVEYDHGTITYPGRVHSRTGLFSALEPTHELKTSWQFQQTSAGNRVFDAPAMLWRRRESSSKVRRRKGSR